MYFGSIISIVFPSIPIHSKMDASQQTWTASLSYSKIGVNSCRMQSIEYLYIWCYLMVLWLFLSVWHGNFISLYICVLCRTAMTALIWWHLLLICKMYFCHSTIWWCIYRQKHYLQFSKHKIKLHNFPLLTVHKHINESNVAYVTLLFSFTYILCAVLCVCKLHFIIIFHFL